MAVPVFLASSHRYLRTNNVTDVDTIINDFRSETKTNGSPAWTEPSAGLFKTPVDDDGRWFDVLLTKISATELEMRVRDKNGVTVCTRRMDIDAGGTDIQICSGEWHFVINSLRATPESMRAFLLDLTPESQVAHVAYTAAHGSRDSAGSLANDYAHMLYLWNFYSSAYGFNYYVELAYMPAVAANLIRQTGAYAFRPAYVNCVNVANLYRQAGRLPQVYLGDTSLSPGTLYDVPIDVGVTAKFTKLCDLPQGATALFVRAD